MKFKRDVYHHAEKELQMNAHPELVQQSIASIFR